MSQTILFIHGAWVTPLCWERFAGFFEQKGFRCLTLAWPYRDKPVETLRQSPPPELATLRVVELSITR